MFKYFVSVFSFFSVFFIVSRFVSQILLKNKEKLLRKVSERYQDLSINKKNKKQEYDSEQYKNLLEDEKQRLVECRKRMLKIMEKRNHYK